MAKTVFSSNPPAGLFKKLSLRFFMKPG